MAVKRSTVLDTLERVEVTSRTEWRAWLKKHHGRTEGIWLVRWKKVWPDKHVTYEEAVEEALCFGWIDSTGRPLDADRAMLYVRPRKAKSMWSKVNKERVERLIATKRMAGPGQQAIATAKANGSWNALDAVESLALPDDLRQALAKSPKARRHFEAFPPSSRKIILHWISSARTEATRSKRIADVVRLAKDNVRANHYRP